jgi:hypothetical protein
VKAITFANAALESYLTLLNTLKIPYNKKPQLVFFLRHLREILQDEHYDATTYKDVFEAFYKLCTCMHFLKMLVESIIIINKKLHSKQVAVVKEHTVKGINTILDGCSFAVEKYSHIVSR